MYLASCIAVFAATFLTTGFLGQCEMLRRIQGTSYPTLWISFLVILLGVTYAILKGVCMWRRDRMIRRIGEMTITHTEIPHLIRPSYQVVNSGYYLLRLYLQGIVRFVYTVKFDAEQQKVPSSELHIDESRLEAVKAQGGRHSTAAISMVKYIRGEKGCSISQVLRQAFFNPANENEYQSEINRFRKRMSWLASLVIVAVLGIAWGLLLAKMTLGINHDKNVGFLGLMIFAGAFAVPMLTIWLTSSCNEGTDEEILAAINRRHGERPHKISNELIARCNDTLPTELERNSILNAYFIEFHTFCAMAEATSPQSFMYMLMLEYQQVQEEFVEAARRAAALREAEAAKNSSGCSSCSSCSSCGGCSGCGGCGGCGD